MATARSSLQGLERSFLDAETGQRGYLLTERKEYLLPYDKALGEIDAAFALPGRATTPTNPSRWRC